MRARNLVSSAVTVVAGIVVIVAFALSQTSEKSATADETPAPNKEARAASRFSPYVDEEGNISLPKDYKRNWAHLGNWAAAKKKGEDIFEMHDVYTQPETITAYNKTGEFPDGAVLVKEVRNSKSKRLTTGHAAWATDMKVWFVMIKDRKGRFKGNDHWGEGWGWALFEAKDPTKNASVDYETTCISCHTPVKDTDWVYVYGYPDLQKHKK